MVTPTKIILGLVAITIPAIVALISGGNRVAVVIASALVAGVGAPLLRGQIKLRRVERHAHQPHIPGIPN